jgi:subtilisin
LAARDDSFAIVGVAPGAPLYAVKVLSDVDNGAELSNIICGVDWVAAHRAEVHVANLSRRKRATTTAEPEPYRNILDVAAY